MQKCTNGAIWSKTSSAISRLSDASQLATKRPIPALLDSLVWSRFSLPAGDCKQALVHWKFAGAISMSIRYKFFCAFSVVIAFACGLAFYGMRGISTSGDLVVRLYDGPLMGINHSRSAHVA